MDLSKPQNDIQKEYDMKIYDLQKDIEELEKQYGFKSNENQFQDQTSLKQQPTQKQWPKQQETKGKGSSINQNALKSKRIHDDGEDEMPQTMRPIPIPLNQAKYLNQPLKQNRYSNLTTIKQEQPKMVKRNPEISEKWPEVFAQKPNLMRFYDKEEFNPVDFNKWDFQTNIHLQKENDVFNDYMDTFALNNL